ncbi:ribosome biogenesis GTPase [Geosporobacter subterraneus DSM 17957]|uniref:Small ribosomal subunit biogenesis GTPase RsgA n=1 Tax=Geosporobacter subterraneus DSM 17957 TaxID=1121919 RepID=A0A1M6P265_9FIRM|nr:ribosome small subunit-dependent GTPase A [Geosporobacter subterraneus]SHK02065.1 ribosome biogenesis GTPase [Geosporobacter subterraneus DSM 17957]
MIKGTIIKGIGGFYYVKTDEKIYECKARGRFRKEKISPLVGDHVHISVNAVSQQGVIEEILDRKTELIRPPVANVDQAVIVFAIQQPDPKLSLLDRFLVLAENEDLDALICFNKIDLGAQSELKRLKELYEQIGYPVIATSTKAQIGIDVLKARLKDQTTVFAGPSGVGKSSLLNSLQPNLALETGEISQKIERGKHTTRHVELLYLDLGGWVLDTPGFSSLQIDFIEKEDLQYLFKEFNACLHDCKFQPCNHVNEPGCAVKRALEEGVIQQSRYDSYLQLLEEIEQARRY